MKPTVHIVLPTHNRIHVAMRFVESLLKQQYARTHLLLVDDGSTDGSASAIGARVPDTTVIAGRGDWWWGGSLHQAFLWMNRSSCPDRDVVLICNDDTELADDTIALGVGVLERNSRTLLASQCRDISTDEVTDVGAYRLDWSTGNFAASVVPSEINCLSTRGLFMRVSDFREIGGFYPRALPHYLSDLEFTYRAGKLGFSLQSTPEVTIGFDGTTTGFHTHDLDTGLVSYFSKKFSKKSPSNPVFWTSFIMLACPPELRAKNVARVWAQAFREFGAVAKRSVPRK